VKGKGKESYQSRITACLILPPAGFLIFWRYRGFVRGKLLSPALSSTRVWRRGRGRGKDHGSTESCPAGFGIVGDLRFLRLLLFKFRLPDLGARGRKAGASSRTPKFGARFRGLGEGGAQGTERPTFWNQGSAGARGWHGSRLSFAVVAPLSPLPPVQILVAGFGTMAKAALRGLSALPFGIKGSGLADAGFLVFSRGGQGRVRRSARSADERISALSSTSLDNQ